MTTSKKKDDSYYCWQKSCPVHPCVHEKSHANCKYSNVKPKDIKGMKWEKRKPIGDYWIEVGANRLDVILHHKDGGTFSDPARAMSALMTALQTQTQANQTREEVIEELQNILDGCYEWPEGAYGEVEELLNKLTLLNQVNKNKDR